MNNPPSLKSLERVACDALRYYDSIPSRDEREKARALALASRAIAKFKAAKKAARA